MANTSRPGLKRIGVIYVGRATELRSRVRSYAGDLRDRRHLARMIPQITAVEAIGCASVHEAAWLERTLLEQSLPRWNRVRGGAEVVCWLQLDDRPRSAGVRLVYEPRDLPVYGPYLGTDRTRLLLTALRRIAPLELTREGLTSFDADLARTVGVGPEDRVRLAAQVDALLRRDPTAVAAATAALHQRRDEAVGAYAYETAGAITAELAALGWASAPQRAAGDLPDADLAAYADGLLVRLAVRDGRLGRWTCTPSTATRAARYVAATPAEWAEPMAAAAELAVRLRAVSLPAPG